MGSRVCCWRSIIIHKGAVKQNFGPWRVLQLKRSFLDAFPILVGLLHHLWSKVILYARCSRHLIHSLSGWKFCGIGLLPVTWLNVIEVVSACLSHLLQDDIPPESAAEEKPCVGICQYYRSLGIENPYEKRQLKRFSWIYYHPPYWILFTISKCHYSNYYYCKK